MNKYKKCVDIDECKLGLDDCGFGSICENKPGSYQCKCPEGMKGKYCHEDINECDDKQERIQIHKKKLESKKDNFATSILVTLTINSQSFRWFFRRV